MIENAATIIAANGPNMAAANTVGSTEIETSMLPVSRTRPRSAMAATAANPSTAQWIAKSVWESEHEKN